MSERYEREQSSHTNGRRDMPVVLVVTGELEEVEEDGVDEEVVSWEVSDAPVDAASAASAAAAASCSFTCARNCFSIRATFSMI